MEIALEDLSTMTLEFAFQHHNWEKTKDFFLSFQKESFVHVH